ncbi:SCO2322 family protein [Streptomyces sp. bgisy100]|uniref:SCO2322 family protein n=1 Tax=Streptomyces sp. bgisy100 TaxID=3413783 RepID=UPI003D70695E
MGFRSSFRSRSGRPAPARVAVAAVVAGAALAVLGAAPAHAQGYRYWSFWDRKGGNWVYATQGPATERPADGEVRGFRFAVSADSKDAEQPRGSARFDTVCAGTSTKAGGKRVAVVLDFGTAADAPDGEHPPTSRTECASVPQDATAAEVLAAVAKPLRYDSGALLCAVSGYPKKGCGEQVADGGGESSKSDGPAGKSASAGSPSSSETDGGDDGPSVGLIAGLAAVLALGAAAGWQARRRRG